MNTLKIFLILALACLLTSASSRIALGQEIEARLSTRETYVGLPVVLQFSIDNASNFEHPKLPAIDGCEIESAGSPSRSSQVTIINGRRSEKNSITFQYMITPRREGTFTIPQLKMKVDGRDLQTKSMTFVASKSETGDLLFVEIVGAKEKVYVGEPLDLTLRIWIKPFQDKKHELTLSEAHMWQMVSPQTKWGSFRERLEELANNGQRPAGREELRDDSDGVKRSYYLYEIDGTVYPKRAGSIDADDVQIIVDYPTELGKARDPFDAFFNEESRFGSGSPLKRMMDDEFFSSPFSNRLTVESARPVVAEAKVGSTKVVPVPTVGRPADYRGAVGQYNIVTQANPGSVNAGDPITLDIGIVGTGPMELVQAPPLYELPAMNTDFKIEDQSLAGVVRDKTKVFSTTIRPRREGVASIPAVPFSYFDPELEKFVTVKSEPIAIIVGKSESLSLESIVGGPGKHTSGSVSTSGENPLLLESSGPNFANDSATTLLVTQLEARANRWWMPFVVAPPLLFLLALLYASRHLLGGLVPTFKSPVSRCRSHIGRSSEQHQIVEAIVGFIAKKSRSECDNPIAAVGSLRLLGLNEIANEVEMFFQEHSNTNDGDAVATVGEAQVAAKEILAKLDFTFSNLRGVRARNTKSSSVSGRRVFQRSLSLLVASASCILNSPGIANELSFSDQNEIQLSFAQQEAILEEATESYSAALAAEGADSAEAKSMFSTSVAKYQLLIDSGVRNGRLYVNLGNACLKNGEFGRAIANYERAKLFLPDDKQLAENLDFAKSLIHNESGEYLIPPYSNGTIAESDLAKQLNKANQAVNRLFGTSTITWIVVGSSLCFWSLLIARILGFRFKVLRWATIPLILLLMSGTSFALTLREPASDHNAIVVVDQLSVYSGDGEQFDILMTMKQAQGRPVKIVSRRGGWANVRVNANVHGWTKLDNIEAIDRSLLEVDDQKPVTIN